MQSVRRVALATLVVLMCVGLWGGVAAGQSAGDAAVDTDGNVSITMYAAPGGALDTLQSAETAADYGDVMLTQTVVANSRLSLVVRLSGPDLADAVASQPGTSRTERFRSLLASDRTSLRNRQIPDEQYITPASLALTDPDVVTVVAVDEDTVDLVVDMSELYATRDTNGNGLADDDRRAFAFGTDKQYQDGAFVNRYNLTFTYRGETENKELAALDTNLTIAPDRTPFRLVPTAGQTVSLDDLFAPGLELTAVVTGTGNTSFRRSETIRITEENAFRPTATFDLTGVSDGAPFSALVLQNGTILELREGRIVEYTTTLSAPNRTAAGRPLALRNVSLSHDGFLAAREDGPDGPIVDIRQVSAGNYTRVPLDLGDDPVDRVSVVAYADVDGDGVYDRGGPDVPARDGNPSLATVRVVPQANLTTQTPTTTETTSATTTTPTPTTTTRPTPEGQATFTTYTVTPTTGPGFGPLAALAAVLLVLLAVRRGGRK